MYSRRLTSLPIRCSIHLIGMIILSFLISDHPAFATSSTSLVHNNIYSSYKIIKALIRPTVTARSSLYLTDDRKGLYLYYCGSLVDDGIVAPIDTGKSDITSSLMDIAFEVILYEDSLSSVGYPQAVWGPFLQQFETEALAHPSAIHDFKLEPLASALNMYRISHNTKLPKASAQTPGCGAGGVAASFQTDPPKGRVLLIPTLYYKFCRIQGLNPDQEDSCNYWHEVHKGQQPDVSGDYMVKLIWPNHTVIRTFRASKLDYGVNTVTLR